MSKAYNAINIIMLMLCIINVLFLENKYLRQSPCLAAPTEKQDESNMVHSNVFLHVYKEGHVYIKVIIMLFIVSAIRVSCSQATKQRPRVHLVSAPSMSL